MCDENGWPFRNFNGCNVEVWDWIRNFIPNFIVDVIAVMHTVGSCFVVIRRPSDRDRCKQTISSLGQHDDVIKWEHLPRYWPFERGIHPSPLNSTHQRPVTRSFEFFFICAWTNGWARNQDAGELSRRGAHYDVTVMRQWLFDTKQLSKPMMVYR